MENFRFFMKFFQIFSSNFENENGFDENEEEAADTVGILKTVEGWDKGLQDILQITLHIISQIWSLCCKE